MDAGEYAARVREIFGDDLLRDAGVVHVASVWASPAGVWRSLRLGPAAPSSATDTFVLATARARADAIVTTGAILRAEPDLCHTLDAVDAMAPGAFAWRSTCLEKHAAPITVVLTNRADIDLDHRLFASKKIVLVTGPVSAERLRARVEERDRGERIDVVTRDPTGLRDVVDWLERDLGCCTVLVEAGVTASRALYDEPICVDELMLSIYCEPTLAADVVGGEFLPRDGVLRRWLEAGGEEASGYESREESGRWRYDRHVLSGFKSLR